MAGFLGTIAGRIQIDVKQAVASYAAVRAANASTLYALRGSSTAFVAAGKGMIVAGGLMAAAFGVAVSAAAEFERKMDFFGAVSNATADQMQKVSDKAIQLGQDTIYSADQIAASFVELGKAGVSADLIISGVGDAVAHLGASADIPLVQAADIITAAVQTFNLKGSEAVHVADLLQGAANASIVDVQDLGVSLKYVGGIASAVSIPIESVIDALSLLGKAGIKGSTAGTSLRQILVSLTGTSKKSTNELKKLGIITKNGTNLFYTAKGSIKPLSDVFQILQDKTKGLTEAQRLSAFKIIFNNRALAAANILAKDGAKGFSSMNKEIGKTTAADISAKRLDNLSGDIEILRGNIETFLIKGGTPFQGFLRTIVQGITHVIQMFTSLPSGVQTAIFAFLGIAGAALLVMGTVSLIIGTVSQFVASMKLLGFAFTFIRGVLGAFVTGMRLLGIAFATNPIGLIITAVALLIVGFILLYQHSETFRNIIANIGKFFVAVWGKVLDFFKAVPGFFSGLWDSIKNAFSTGLQWIKDNWKLLLVIIGGPLVWIGALIFKFKDKIIGFFQGLWSGATQWVSKTVTSVVEWFKTLPERIAYWLGYLLGRYIRFWIDMYTWAFNTAKNIVIAVVNFFKELPGKIVAYFQDLWNKTVIMWTAIWTWLTQMAKKIVDGVISFFTQLPGRAAALFTLVKDWIIARVTALWTAATALAKKIVDGIIGFFTGLPGKAAQVFTTMKTRGTAILGDLLTSAKDIAGKIVSGFISIITGLPGLVLDVFKKVLGAIGSLAGSIADKAKSVASSLWNGFKDGLGINSPSYLEKAVFQINRTFGDEIPKMKKQVQKIQTFTDDVVTNNPAARASDAAGKAIDALNKAQKSLIPVSNSLTAGKRVAGNPAVAAPISGSSGKPGMTKIYDVKVNNPKPEPASKSITSTLQTIGALGIGDTANE